MTNPDNVGGLPELPEPEFLTQLGNEAYSAKQMRAYGELCIADARRTSSYWKAELIEANKEIDRLRELCRAAPADNAGRLSELPEPSRVASIVRKVALFNGGLIADDLAKVEAFLANLDEAANRVYRLIPTLPVTAENIDAATRAITQFCYDFQPLIRDVVDAAPDGGDVERDADFYSAGYSNGYKHATKDSAPAGSGEVDALVATLRKNLENPIAAGEEYDGDGGFICVRTSDAAAILRKLSQGADYVMVPRVPTDAMLEAAHEAAHVWRANAWRDAERARYAAMIAASQGQEGGRHE